MLDNINDHHPLRYKKVIVYINSFLGMKMLVQQKPIFIDNAENELFFYMLGFLACTEIIDTKKVHIIPKYCDPDSIEINTKMELYSFNIEDIISIEQF